MKQLMKLKVLLVTILLFPGAALADKAKSAKPLTPIEEIREAIAKLRDDLNALKKEVAELRQENQQLRASLPAPEGALFEVKGTRPDFGRPDQSRYDTVRIRAKSAADAVAKARRNGLTVAEKYDDRGELQYPDVKRIED
jgi:HAMP domain-containing protein